MSAASRALAWASVRWPRPEARARPAARLASGSAYVALAVALGALALVTGCKKAAGGASEASQGEASPPAPPSGAAPLAVTGAVTSSGARGPQGGAAAQGEASCAARYDALVRAGSPGTPALDAVRAQVLGRALATPVVFVREPTKSEPALLEPGKRRPALAPAPSGVTRVGRLTRALAGKPRELRAALLREGYLYTDDPGEAVALVQSVTLADLFDEEVVTQARGDAVSRLEKRPPRKGEKKHRYVYASGPRAGDEATVWLFDRLAAGVELGPRLDADVMALTREGYERLAVRGRDAHALAVELEAGGARARAVVELGPTTRVSCFASPTHEVERLRAATLATRPEREALRAMSAAIDAIAREALRFDRPHGEKTADRDGELRPRWAEAYRHGRPAFSIDGRSYPVFDPSGRPLPPEVCVDFVLDVFERGSGTWFRPLGDAPGRTTGGLDLGAHGLRELRGVLALEAAAAKRPELFEAVRFVGPQRVPFGERTRYLAQLTDVERREPALAKVLPSAPRLDVRAGDIVAIQGEKRDGLIHQHAIFVEAVDPLTGLPFGLADQMNKPRRRTWEGIMAEAPKRSLLYRLRPKGALFRMVASTASVEAAPPAR
jgi:hypothetical protein